MSFERLARSALIISGGRLTTFVPNLAHWKAVFLALVYRMMRLAGPTGAVATVAGGVFYQAGKKLNEFAKGTLALNDMSKMTGFTITQIEKFSQVMGRLDIDRQAAQTGMASFAGTLFKLRTHTGGELRNFLTQRGGKPAEELVGKLETFAAKGQNDKALAAATEYLEKLDKVDHQFAAIVAQLLFGDPNFRKLAEYNDQLAKSGDITDRNAAAARKYEDAISSLREKAKGLAKSLATKGLSLANKGIDLVSPGDKAAADSLKSAEEKLAKVDKKLEVAGPGSTKFRMLSTEREELVKEIDRLKKSLQELGDKVEPPAKKMSFVGGSLGGGGITQASLGGGGGIQSYWGEGGKADRGGIGRPMGGGGGLSGSDQGTPSGGGSLEPGVGAERGKVGRGDDPRGLEGYIRERAAKDGVDPDTAVAVAKSEGLRNPVGDHGMSHGAFQLFKGGGLGNEFQKETGKDPADPANEKETIDFALRRTSKGGWGPWHGAKKTGISRFAGIGGAPGVGGGTGAVGDNKGGGKYRGAARVRGVPESITELVRAGAQHLPDGYSVRMSSGYRAPWEHNHSGHAADFKITGPDGKDIRNQGDDPTGKYTELSRHVYGEMLAGHPELKGRLAWGGAFPPKSGNRDLMHYDLNGERGRYGRHWMSRMGPIPGEKYGADWEQAHREKMDKAQGNEMSAKVEGTGKLTV